MKLTCTGWTDEQHDKLTAAAIAACPALDSLPAEQVVAWTERAERTGAPFDQAMVCLTELALSHRKGQPRPQPGDVLQAFKSIAAQGRTGQVAGHRLSAEAAANLPTMTSRFVRHPNAVEGSHYGRPIAYAGDKPWPPVGVVESAYREAQGKGRQQAHAIIAARCGAWYAGQEG